MTRKCYSDVMRRRRLGGEEYLMSLDDFKERYGPNREGRDCAVLGRYV
jgi:hypothetical protein